MNNKLAKEPEFSEKFEELRRKIESRDATKQMSNRELLILKRTIDDEIIHRKVVERIQILANQLK